MQDDALAVLAGQGAGQHPGGVVGLGPQALVPDDLVDVAPQDLDFLQLLLLDGDLVGAEGGHLYLGWRGKKQSARVGEAGDHVLLRGVEQRGFEVQKHAGAADHVFAQALARDHADRRVLDGDHVQQAAGDQAAAVGILDDGHAAVGGQSSPGLVRLEVAQVGGDALPVGEGRGVAREEAAAEVGVQAEDPAGAGDTGVANRLEVVFHLEDLVGGRGVGDPDRGVGPGAGEEQEARIGQQRSAHLTCCTSVIND